MSQVASAAIASTMTDLTASPARYKWTHFALAVFVFPRGDSAQQFTDEFLDKTIISIHDLQSTYTQNNYNVFVGHGSRRASCRRPQQQAICRRQRRPSHGR
jgi:hypothetical protein